jgi:hypothetical protein
VPVTTEHDGHLDDRAGHAGQRLPAGGAEHADRDRDRQLEVAGREGFSPWACATQPSSLCSIGPAC